MKGENRISAYLDEVYVAKWCEFTRNNVSIYGMENGEPTKTLFTIMFKSVAADYNDVIAMVPTTKNKSSLYYGCMYYNSSWIHSCSLSS